MTTLSLTGNASGVGVFTVVAPNSANTRTLTLPDATTTFVGTDTTQTLTNKTIQGGAITSGTAVASTSGTSIDFTSIPSWVKRITVMFDGVSTNGTSLVQLQIGAGSVTTSGYVSYATYAGGVNQAAGVTGTTGFYTEATGAGTSVRSGHVVITLQNTNTWVASVCVGFYSGVYYYSSNGGGSITLGGALDRVRITTANGTDTFDAGSINILME
jgi:hypothetical protein